MLVAAGAGTATRDKAWGGTPHGWAEHYVNEAKGTGDTRQYAEIVEYLRNRA
jgi:hypothetical protein